MANPHPLISKANEFANDVLRPRAQSIDSDGGIPKDIVQQMGELGFLGCALPEQYGGSQVDALTYGWITEAIGMGCSNTRVMLTVHTSLVGETLAKLGTKDQQERYLPDLISGKRIGCFALSEPEAGSDAASIQTQWQADGDDYLLNGYKKWISLGAISDVFLVFATNEGRTNAFLVDRDMPGVSTTPMSGLLANNGAHLAEVHFDNVKVPAANLVGRPGMGFAFVANTALFYGRFSIAWAGVSLARAAVEEMVTYSRYRNQFDTKLAKHQLVQALIADSTVGLHSARAICEKISHQRMNNDESAIMETNIAKLYTSRIATEAANNAVQVFGGNGLWKEYSPERLYREARVLEIIEGTTQIQQMMIANYAARHYYQPKLKKQYQQSSQTQAQKAVKNTPPAEVAAI